MLASSNLIFISLLFIVYTNLNLLFVVVLLTSGWV